MNEHTLRVLEYHKVKSIVATYAASEAGSLLVTGLQPARDQQTAAILIAETREFMQILRIGENPPLEGIPVTGKVLEKLKVTGMTLSAAELLNLALALNAGRRVQRFFQRFEGKGSDARPAAPLLCALAAKIRPLKQIEDAILAAIDDQAEVKDAASPDLRKIRKHITRLREEILGRMTSILQDGAFQKVIQEPVITVRDDRYVMPLKPNFRQSLQGVVHGQSGSRATLFVEPLEMLEQNNRLAELRMEEREEIERILRKLTSLLAAEADALETTINTLADLDAVCARARFGIEYDCTVPDVTQGRNFRLPCAQHPLLTAKFRARRENSGVVPNDIVLGGKREALILSGPNTGGKTVVLKTAGLLCLMAQSGIPITAGAGSELPCFRSVFADIGDEQNLEQDLSTFSSHVSRISEILEQAGADSLVLLDELGAGTEPGEGAALGAAVLESLIERKCTTIVTTHYNALKLFGAETSGALNAAMDFDPGTLKPTYRLIPGRPGRSYGLDMAARIGVPADVIERARSRQREDEVRLEKLLEQVEEDSRVIASERLLLEKEVAAAREGRNAAEALLLAARSEAREVKARARAEAGDILSELRRKLRELSRAASLEQAEAKRKSAEIEALGSKLRTDLEAEEPAASFRTPDFHAGDIVRIGRWNRTGRVLTAGGDRLELDVGGKKIRLSAANVIPIDAEKGKRPAATESGWSADLRLDEGRVDQLNIIGLRVAEGLAEVDRFIDRAGMHHLSAVTVIHGLGTGALKTAVADFLKDHPLVASVRAGEPAEGGAGVTVAELKK